MRFIEHGESLLLNRGEQMSPGTRLSPKPAVSSIKAVLALCDGSMFQYTSLFDQNVLQLVSVLYSTHELDVFMSVPVCVCVCVCVCDRKVRTPFIFQVQSLRQKMHHAKLVLAQQLRPLVPQGAVTMQPPPSLSFSSPSSLSPHASSRAPAVPTKQQPQVKRWAS